MQRATPGRTVSRSRADNPGVLARRGGGVSVRRVRRTEEGSASSSSSTYAFLATLCLAGPRISELIKSPRGRLDLRRGTGCARQEDRAGIDRTLEVSPFLLDELRAHLAAVPDRLRDSRGAGLWIFPTWTGGTHDSRAP
jgi:integrase